jgi:hypothetical protein
MVTTLLADSWASSSTLAHSSALPPLAVPVSRMSAGLVV